MSCSTITSVIVEHEDSPGSGSGWNSDPIQIELGETLALRMRAAPDAIGSETCTGLWSFESSPNGEAWELISSGDSGIRFAVSIPSPTDFAPSEHGTYVVRGVLDWQGVILEGSFSVQYGKRRKVQADLEPRTANAPAEPGDA